MNRILLPLVAFAALVCGRTVWGAAEYTLTIATHVADESEDSRTLYWLSDRVREKSGGRLQINVSTSAALGGQREIIEAVNFGAIEMGMGECGLYSNYDRAFGIISLPFVHSSPEAFAAAVDGEVGKRLNAIMEAKTNMSILAWMDGVRTRDIYSLKPLNGLDDLKGLKIRTPESSVFVATFRAFGANPTPISAPEMYTALQQGVVQAMEGTTETAVTYGIYELTKTCLESHHIYNEMSIVINRNALAELPVDLRKVLVECAVEMSAYSRKLSGGSTEGYKKRMREAGIKFVAIDREKAKALVALVYKEYLGNDPQLNEIFNLLMEVQKQ
jgi:tripartite ATP-independent transporter DctP family solute receptor